MEITINTDKNLLVLNLDGETRTYPLYSDDSFLVISDLWAKVGWNQKYMYTFSWLGRPIIQLPEDMIRIQEKIWEIKPDVIIETGVAHGGSLIYYASLCKTIGKGMVIGVDIEIRPHNRKAIEEHSLFQYITLIEGNSIDPMVMSQISEIIPKNAKVMVILDSCHTKEHVLAEMRNYAPFVDVGSYLVVTDGVMKDLADVPRGNPDWEHDNPYDAIQEFFKENNSFIEEPVQFPFNESTLNKGVSHWKSAYLKRVIGK